MVVVGLRRYARTIAVLTVICEHCGNPATHRLVRRTRRIVLFFVPLVAVSRSWAITCTYCAHATSLSAGRVDALLVGAAPRPVPQIRPAQRS